MPLVTSASGRLRHGADSSAALPVSDRFIGAAGSTKGTHYPDLAGFMSGRQIAGNAGDKPAEVEEIGNRVEEAYRALRQEIQAESSRTQEQLHDILQAVLDIKIEFLKSMRGGSPPASTGSHSPASYSRYQVQSPSAQAPRYSGHNTPAPTNKMLQRRQTGILGSPPPVARGKLWNGVSKSSDALGLVGVHSAASEPTFEVAPIGSQGSLPMAGRGSMASSNGGRSLPPQVPEMSIMNSASTLQRRVVLDSGGSRRLDDDKPFNRHVRTDMSLDSMRTPTDIGHTASSMRLDDIGHQLSLPQSIGDKMSMVANASSGEEAPSHTQLPEGWPCIIEVRDQVIDFSSLSGGSSVQMMMAALEEDRYNSELDVSRPSSWAKHFVLDPNSRICIMYDLLSLMILFYDLTIIPTIVAWDLPGNIYTRTLIWVTLCFWTFDVILNFFRGYDKSGFLHLDPVDIARNYLRGYFVIDVGIVGADWLSMMLLLMTTTRTASNGEFKMLRFAKVGRLLRMFAMMRVVKYLRIFDELVNSQIAVKYYILLKVVSVVMALLWFNHLLACVWYSIGVYGATDTGTRWTQMIPEFFDHGFSYEYWTSFHWAISQCVLGAIEIPSVSSMERLYTILCMVAGLVIGSTLVSSLSASMVEFQMSSNERSHTLRTLRIFLNDQKVSSSVAARVQKQVRERLGQKKRLTDRDVPALDLLADTLRATLRTEIYSSKITSLPIFQLWSQLDNALIRALCTEGVEFVYLRPLDYLITPGREVNFAFVLDQGAAVYSQAAIDRSLRSDSQSSEEILEQGKWICEMALWTYWVTVGAVQAVETVESIKVSESTVNALLNLSGPTRELSMEYRRIYHERIVQSTPPFAHFPTDLTVSFASFADIASAMNQDMKAMLARHFLATEVKSWRWTNALRRLTEELEKRSSQSGGVVLPLFEGGGGLERIVLTVAAQIESDEGHYLVQIGRWNVDDGDKIIAMCQLPSCKQDTCESPQDAMKRLMSTRLSVIQGDVVIHDHSRESTVRSQGPYQQFNVLTTTYSCTVTGAFSKAWCHHLEDWKFHISTTSHAPAHHQSESFEDAEGGQVVYIITSGHNRKWRSVLTWMPPSQMKSLITNPGLVDATVSPLLAALPLDEFKQHQEESGGANRSTCRQQPSGPSPSSRQEALATSEPTSMGDVQASASGPSEGEEDSSPAPIQFSGLSRTVLVFE